MPNLQGRHERITPVAKRQDIDRRGLLFGFGSYFLWGLFPLYFRLLSRSSAFEIVAYRIVCSLVFCVLAITVTRHWRGVKYVLANRRAVVVLAGAGLLVSANWTLYVWGVNNGHAIDASLGYFINPLMSAALGVIVLGERMRRAQWVAFGVSTVAVIVLIVGYGNVPWVALGLATSFALYGLLKKKANVGAAESLAVETGVLVLPALGYLWWLDASGAGTFGHLSTSHSVLLAGAGLVTVLPLLAFSAAATRIPLSTLGLLQYLGPSLQFAIGVFVYREPMPPSRLAGFALVWVALALFTTEGLRHRHRAAATSSV